jgi:ATP-dependent RNA helicase DDX10/DBP4
VGRLKENLEIGDSEEENMEKGFLQTKNALNGSEAETGEIEDLV